MLHLPSRTVRLRLTLLYSGLFLVSGLALLATTYLLFRSNTGVDLIVSTGTPHRSTSPGALNHALANPEAARQVRQMYAGAVERETHGLHQGLIQSGIALAIMTGVSIALGWLVAGRGPAPAAHDDGDDAADLRAQPERAPRLPRDELKDLADTVDGLLARGSRHTSLNSRDSQPTPFQRGTARIRADHAGVGLGLEIVNSIAQAHHGTLTLTPHAAGGLCVTVELPAAAATPARDDPRLRRPAATPRDFRTGSAPDVDPQP